MKTKFITSIIILSVCSFFIFLTPGCESEADVSESTSELSEQENSVFQSEDYTNFTSALSDYQEQMSAILDSMTETERNQFLSDMQDVNQVEALLVKYNLLGATEI